MTRAYFLLLAVGLASAVAVAQPQPTKPVIEQIEDAWKARADKVKTAEFALEVEKYYPKGSISAQFSGGLPTKHDIPDKDTRTKYTARYALDGEQVHLEIDGYRWNGRAFGNSKEVAHITPDGRKQLQQNEGAKTSGDILRSADYFRAKADPFGPITYHLRGAGRTPMRYSKLPQFQPAGGRTVRGGASCVQLTWIGDEGNRETIWVEPEKDWRVVARSTMSEDGSRTESSFHYADNLACGSVPSGWEMRTLDKAGRSGVTQTVRVLKAEVNGPLAADRFRIDFPAGTVVYDDSTDPSLRQVVQPGGDLAPHPNTDPALLASLKRPITLRLAVGVACLVLLVLCTVGIRRRYNRPLRPQRHVTS